MPMHAELAFQDLTPQIFGVTPYAPLWDSGTPHDLMQVNPKRMIYCRYTLNPTGVVGDSPSVDDLVHGDQHQVQAHDLWQGNPKP
jgi:hypothetical protein